MKKALYIGAADTGSTALMRYTTLCHLLKSSYEIGLIDTSNVFKKHGRIANSLGVRYKLGPLITTVNEQIKNSLGNEYEFIWVDKAALITPSTISELRKRTNLLIHYTPDPAFMYNQSVFFRKSISCFDHCITTKSFEIAHYKEHNAKSLLYCTQGYDARVHFPRHEPSEKAGIAFIGRHEPGRERIIAALLRANFTIKLGGPRWNTFAKRHGHNKNLIYYGHFITGYRYAEIISSSKIALGLLSKLIPEKHTTRTFEIPACGALLATERNEETQKFLADNEALFYSSKEELIRKIETLIDDSATLQDMTERGHKKVTGSGYDYPSILASILEKTAIR